MGTAPFTVPTLERLRALGHDIPAVYTQPPRPAGRGHKLQRSAVHEAAERLGLEVRTPRTLRDADVQAEFRALGADLAVVGAYGLLLPKPILDAPRLGCVNLHASLLPRWRGAAPIQRAILAGDTETGISLFRMEEGLDTGPVYAMRPTPIGPRTTAPELHDRLAALAAEMAPEVLDGIAAGTLVRPAAAGGGRHLRRQAPTRGGRARLHRAGDADRAPPARAQPLARLPHELRGRAPVAARGRGGRGSRRARHGDRAAAHHRVRRGGAACHPGPARGTRAMTPEELQRGFPIPVGTSARLMPATA